MDRILFGLLLVGAACLPAQSPRAAVVPRPTARISTPAELQADCHAALVTFFRETGAGFAGEPPLIAQQSSVDFVGFRSGRWGGVVHRLRLKPDDRGRSTWLSSFAERHYDTQGDPRWFISAVGPKTASFFGFRILSDTEMEIPDATEFIAALARVNAYLRSVGQNAFRFGFFATESDADVWVATYVRRVAERLEQPIAPSGHHLVHDLGYHLAMLFAPDAFADVIQGSAGLRVAFFDYLARKYAGDQSLLALIKPLSYVANFRETVRLDGFTGTLGFSIARAESTPEGIERASSQLRKAIEDYKALPGQIDPGMLRSIGIARFRFPDWLSDWSASDHFLAEMLWIQSPGWRDHRPFYQPFMDKNKFEAARASSRRGYPSTQLLSDYHEFLAQDRSLPGFLSRQPLDRQFPGYRTNAFEAEHDPELAEQWYRTFCHEVRINKMRLIEAVGAID